MKKRMIGSIGLICLFIVMEGYPFVYAETTDRNTDANITFEPNTGPTQPVDPDDPTVPIPEVPGVKGQLVIIFASNFNFGTRAVSPTRRTYGVVTDRPNIQIADLRGSGTGWALDASVSPFRGENEETVLNGSRILITNGRLLSQTSMEHAPTVSTNVVLTTDNRPTRVILADENQGQGLWINRMYPENPEEEAEEEEEGEAYVLLEVPAGVATAGNYTATITWTLSDTP